MSLFPILVSRIFVNNVQHLPVNKQDRMRSPQQIHSERSFSNIIFLMPKITNEREIINQILQINVIIQPKIRLMVAFIFKRSLCEFFKTFFLFVLFNIIKKLWAKCALLGVLFWFGIYIYKKENTFFAKKNKYLV